jgi:hypothetical protein
MSSARKDIFWIYCNWGLESVHVAMFERPPIGSCCEGRTRSAEGYGGLVAGAVRSREPEGSVRSDGFDIDVLCFVCGVDQGCTRADGAGLRGSALLSCSAQARGKIGSRSDRLFRPSTSCR